MKYIVYQTINLVNNKIYVGVHKTENPEIFDGYIGCGVRINNSNTYSHPTTAFQYAVKKYGPSNFRRTILHIYDNKYDAYKMEEIIVNKDFIKRNDVYNMIVGGIQAPTNAIEIYQFDLNGKLLKKWESTQEASSFLGISHTSILNAIKYKGSCNKFYWSRQDNINPSEYTLNSGTMCYKYRKEDGKLVQTYNSIPEAAKDSDEFMQSIQRAIKGGFEVKGFYYSTNLYETYEIQPKTQLRNNYLYVYDLEGNYLTKLMGIKQICEYFKIKSNCVIYTAIRCNRPYKQFQFSLEYKEKLEPIKNKRNISKPVEQYDQSGNLITTFDSITKAEEKFGTGVLRVLKGQQQLCKGFIFRYKSL